MTEEEVFSATDDLTVRTWKKRERDLYKEGYREGALKGQEKNYQHGFDVGYCEGFKTGEKLGYQKGFQSLLTQLSPNNPDVINKNSDLQHQDTSGICILCNNNESSYELEEILVLQSEINSANISYSPSKEISDKG